MHPFLRGCAAVALAFPCLAHAQSADDVRALRKEIDAMRTEYEARIRALEAKLQAAEAAAVVQPAPVAAAPAAPPAPSRGGFNPAISMILSGQYARTSLDPSSRGFSVSETELGITANIDPWFMGAANIAFAPDNTVSVEEAFIQTTSLGNGLTLKAGRFLSGIGYLNSQHAHQWDFADAPAAYQSFLGGQYHADGMQLAWLAPTDHFIEVRGELAGRGSSALALHTGGDIGDSQSWRAGVSVLHAKTDTSNTRVWIADGVWKWAPDGNATRTSFKLQGEYLRSLPEGLPAQDGWYVQGVYQFMPRWRVGLRTERLDDAAKNSVMVDFSPSEFSRVRLQLARDRTRPGLTDNQLFLQYQMSLGAHGAHSF